MSVIGAVLAWPSDSGVAGGAIGTVVFGLPAYLHSHRVLRRHHAQRLGRLERYYLEARADATAHHNALVAALRAAEPRVSGGSTPFDSRERLDGPPAATPRARKTKAAP